MMSEPHGSQVSAASSSPVSNAAGSESVFMLRMLKSLSLRPIADR